MTTTKTKSTRTVSKPVVKKTAVKKIAAAAKKTPVKKTTSRKPLTIAPDQSSFWVHNGLILNSLAALHGALSSMDATVYTYHATKDTNHFADWVAIVLKDTKCAEDLRGATTVTRAKAVVAKHLKNYQL